MFDRAIRYCDRISALWVVLLAILIFGDVCSRYFLNSPIHGTAEIIANSIVAIVFLQLPLAIQRNGMIRTTIILDRVSPTTHRALCRLSYLLGFLLFLAIAYSSWQPFLDAWRINEYEGEGALRVPTYPVRFILFGACSVAAIVYIRLLYRVSRDRTSG